MEFSNFSDMEYSEYMSQMIAKIDRRAQLAYARKEGRAEGFGEGEARGLAIGTARGREEGFIEIAHNMLGDGVKPTLVARYTKLPLKTVKALL